jgi:predicted short-subunit dehydrogenase-like oxidoreductase (DUF2520 family)
MTGTAGPAPRTAALVGAGRAGTAVAIALDAAGWSLVRIAGRRPDAPSVVAAAARFGAPAVDAADVGRGAALVVIGTPDAAIRDTARALAPSLEPGALVVHLAGAVGLDALGAVAAARPDVEVGALHPLQTLPSPDVGAARLAGSWAGIAGPPAVRALAEELGMTPFELADDDRGAYHAAATVASNHVTALLGQVERIAATASVPLAAFEPLVRATVDHCFAMGPAAALTGPVARGEIETVLRHLEAVAADEQRAYRALAAAAARLAPRDDPRLRELLDRGEPG